MDKEIFIVFFSANSGTRVVADIFQEGLLKNGLSASALRLGSRADTAAAFNRIKAAGSNACLFVGSPVYRDGAVPIVVSFLESLPALAGAMAVPFVTWGQACSGLALWQMGSVLVAKGFTLAGAAKVLAVHSLMWRVRNPPGCGHPGPEDRRQLLEMVDRLVERFENENGSSIGIERLDYQPEPQGSQIKAKIAGPWQIVPKTVDHDLCTQCGICAQECPVEAVGLNPYPEFSTACCDCFNCIRLCPEEAIAPALPMDKIEGYIRERVKGIDERPHTQIFL